jgi:hypothetical protein
MRSDPLESRRRVSDDRDIGVIALIAAAAMGNIGKSEDGSGRCGFLQGSHDITGCASSLVVL